MYFIYVSFKTFRSVISAVMRYDCHNYINQIWNYSGSVYKSSEIFSFIIMGLKLKQLLNKDVGNYKI